MTGHLVPKGPVGSFLEFASVCLAPWNSISLDLPAWLQDVQ